MELKVFGLQRSDEYGFQMIEIEIILTEFAAGLVRCSLELVCAVWRLPAILERSLALVAFHEGIRLVGEQEGDHLHTFACSCKHQCCLASRGLLALTLETGWLRNFASLSSFRSTST